MKSALIILSLGVRPWIAYSTKWALYYCSKFDIDFIFLNSPPIENLSVNQFDRRQNWSRIQKLGIGKYFDIYDRIILIDDTCLICPTTPNIIDMVPPKEIGCMIEGKYKDCHEYYRFHSKIYNTPSLGENDFFNGGFLVLSTHHKELFREFKHYLNFIIEDSYFPTQGYLSLIVRDKGIQLFDLGPEYNFIGGMILKCGSIDSCPSAVKVFHLTSKLTKQQRMGMAREIDALFTHKRRNS